MNARLSLRLVASHVAVALAGALVAYFVVHALAPGLFDEATRGLGYGPGGPGGPGDATPAPNRTPGSGQGWGRGQGSGLGPGSGQGLALRAAFASAVDTALLVGLLAGALVAAGLAWASSRALLAPLRRVRDATRQLAAGDYAVRVAPPREAELAALAADVNSLGSSLRDSEARRTRLIAEVAHELRTPLTIIDGYVEGMIDGVFAPDAARLGAISGEVARMRRLADDFGALSRAQEGRLELRPADVDLGEVAAAAAHRLRSQFDDAGVSLDIATGPDAGPALPVHADPDRVAQIVGNLVGNALRATPRGGRVTLRARADGPHAVVEVADTGRGLAPEDVDRIFERFYRVPSPSTGPGGGGPAERPTRPGSGIGLTIARGLARAHGGDVTAASEGPGRGATFTFTLPLRSGPGA